jgi:methionyl-tRNA formyltransferase
MGSLICTKKEMKIAVKNGFIQILSLQFPGKKKMSTPELLKWDCIFRGESSLTSTKRGLTFNQK